jgi:hypothetical protein
MSTFKHRQKERTKLTAALTFVALFLADVAENVLFPFSGVQILLLAELHYRGKALT